MVDARFGGRGCLRAAGCLMGVALGLAAVLSVRLSLLVYLRHMDLRRSLSVDWPWAVGWRGEKIML